MVFLTLLLLLPLADASIRLQHSVLYDEDDFKGVDQLTTDVCAAGCSVYATIAGTESKASVITGRIMVVDPNTQEQTSVFDLSRTFNLDTMAKDALEIAAAPTLTILNTNDKRDSARLALWIVSANAPFYRTAEVFDPANLNKKGIASAPITILSAYPFTVTAQPGDANGVVARVSGYDAIDVNGADNCFLAMDKDFGQSFAGFSLAINGPLLTLSFDTAKYPLSKVELTANNALSFDLNPFATQPTFISSAGFMCGGASHQYTLRTPSDKIMTFNFAIDMDTDLAHPVTIFDHKTRQNYTFAGNFKDATSQVNAFTLRTYRASVIFTPGSEDVFYGMRRATVGFTPGSKDGFYGMRVWTGDDGGDETKTTGEESKTKETTTSSTDYRSLVPAIAIVAAIFA